MGGSGASHRGDGGEREGGARGEGGAREMSQLFLTEGLQSDFGTWG